MSTNMTQDDLEALAELMEKISPEPWEFARGSVDCIIHQKDGYGGGVCEVIVELRKYDRSKETLETLHREGDNLKFIEAARANVPQLLVQARQQLDLLEPLRDHRVDSLAAKAAWLKTTDGEGWAIGEFLERAVAQLRSEKT